MRIARPLIHKIESLVRYIYILIAATRSPRAISIALGGSLIDKKFGSWPTLAMQ